MSAAPMPETAESLKEDWMDDDVSRREWLSQGGKYPLSVPSDKPA